jgi:hypothetical protein
MLHTGTTCSAKALRGKSIPSAADTVCHSFPPITDTGVLDWSTPVPNNWFFAKYTRFLIIFVIIV